MATFLNTDGMNKYILESLSSCIASVTLVSPYLDLSKEIRNQLNEISRAGKNIKLVYRESCLNQKNKTFLFNLENVEIFYCEQLHAKCYFNENLMIVGSMNLYEFSQLNNREIGVLIKKSEDETLFSDVINEVKLIMKSSLFQKNVSDLDSQTGTKVKELNQTIMPTIQNHHGATIQTLNSKQSNIISYEYKSTRNDENYKRFECSSDVIMIYRSEINPSWIVTEFYLSTAYSLAFFDNKEKLRKLNKFYQIEVIEAPKRKKIMQ